MTKFDLKKYDRNYDSLVKEEISEWVKIEGEAQKSGIPVWTDMRRAKVGKKNLFWRDDPVKDKIVLGLEKALLIKLASQKKGKVLDLGCGSGWLCLELARRGMNVRGVDVSPDRIKIARKYLKENPYKKNFGKVKYQVADLNKTSLPKGEFEAIVAWNTLHHFPRLGSILKKIDYALKPGGKLIVFDHIGHPLLKAGSQVLRLVSKKAKEENVIEYEDVLGRKMIELIEEHFEVMLMATRLSFPISGLLFLIFKQDRFLPLLPALVKIDRALCKSKLFTGEHFFIEAVKK